MLTPAEQIAMYERQVQECRRLQKPGDWMSLLGELDAEAELYRLRQEMQTNDQN